VRRSLGALAYAQGDTAQAITHYQEATALSPRRYDLPRELGWLLLDTGRHDEARASFDRMLENAPTMPFLRGERALAALAAGDRTDFAAVLARLEQMDPKSLPPGAQASIAWLRLLSVDTRAALARADQIASLIAADPVTLDGPWETFLAHSFHIDLAAIFVRAGERDKAEPFLARAWQMLNRLENNRVTWHSIAFLKARILALRDDNDGALDQLEAAVTRGFRRAWWLRHDPAFVTLRANPRFGAIASTRRPVETRAQPEPYAQPPTPARPAAAQPVSRGRPLG
jgi:tetratricopeptide (TPR) repeat protein